MNTNDVKKEMIDLGEFCLKQDSNAKWDFYRKYNGDVEKEEPCTFEKFDSVEIVGNVVYVSKKRIGRIFKGIYTFEGVAKISLTDSFIDCDLTFLAKQDCHSGWDFYTKEGEKITDKAFDYVMVIGNLVRVTKNNHSSRLLSGIYNNEGKEILAVEWKDVFIVAEKFPKNPKYIKVKDHNDFMGICNAKGYFLMEPNQYVSIELLGEKVIKAKAKDGTFKYFGITDDNRLI